MGNIYIVWTKDKTASDGMGEPSTSNARYVGKTINTSQTRIAQHVAAAEGKPASRSLFEQKMASVGADNYAWRTLESDVPESKLASREKYYIALYQTHTTQGGYNETWGG